MLTINSQPRRARLYVSDSTNDGRIDKDEKRITETKFGIKAGMGRARSLADTLRCLELDMAGN